jgi:Tfp pilus assembly protein PilF
MDDTQALHLAREEIRKGNKPAARTLLAQVLKGNPRSETAWLLLSAAVDDPAQEQDCLKRVKVRSVDNRCWAESRASLAAATA